MNKILNCLANKVMCTAVVALGAFAASAESVLTTNALYDAVNTDVSVGYQVSGLEGEEIAVVFTNDACEVINWKVPARLENVQFLVVGGGGGGGGGATLSLGASGGGGGGVVTGSVFSLKKNANVSITVGMGGEGGKATEYIKDEKKTKGEGKAVNGGFSEFLVNGTQYVRAPGGGGDTGYNTTGGLGGSNSGSRNTTRNVHSFDNFITNLTYVVAVPFGNAGGTSNAADCTSGGGGGGALKAGQDGTKSPRKSGDGGAGLVSSITGVEVTYGSGGGGGQSYHVKANGDAPTPGNGGEGAGRGANYYNSSTTGIFFDETKNHGIDKEAHGVANQGGGGGGGFKKKDTYTRWFDGGNGGSGIVVFRYKDPIKPGFKVIVR